MKRITHPAGNRAPRRSSITGQPSAIHPSPKCIRPRSALRRSSGRRRRFAFGPLFAPGPAISTSTSSRQDDGLLRTTGCQTPRQKVRWLSSLPHDGTNAAPPSARAGGRWSEFFDFREGNVTWARQLCRCARQRSPAGGAGVCRAQTPRRQKGARFDNCLATPGFGRGLAPTARRSGRLRHELARAAQSENALFCHLPPPPAGRRFARRRV